MCDVSFLCHLSGNRFVASTRNTVVLQSEHGHKTLLQLLAANATIEMYLHDKCGKQTTLAKKQMHCNSHKASLENTACIARAIVDIARQWYFIRKCACNLQQSIKDGFRICHLERIIACFCKLQTRTLPTTTNTFGYTDGTTVAFNHKYTHIIFRNGHESRVRIDGSGWFSLRNTHPCLASDDGLYNWDEYVANICHLIFAYND